MKNKALLFNLDKNNLDYLILALDSLVFNATKKYKVFISYTNLSKKEILFISNRYKSIFDFKFIDVTEDVKKVSKLLKQNKVKERVSAITYGYIFALEILKKEKIDFIYKIDPDVYFFKNISNLLLNEPEKISLVIQKNNKVAYDRLFNSNKYSKEKLEKLFDNKLEDILNFYSNTGLIIFNSKNLNFKKMNIDLFNFIKKKGKLTFFDDQDFINWYFNKNNEPISSKYNFCWSTATFANLKNKSIHFKNIRKINILHFAGFWKLKEKNRNRIPHFEKIYPKFLLIQKEISNIK